MANPNSRSTASSARTDATLAALAAEIAARTASSSGLGGVVDIYLKVHRKTRAIAFVIRHWVDGSKGGNAKDGDSIYVLRVDE